MIFFVMILKACFLLFLRIWKKNRNQYKRTRECQILQSGKLFDSTIYACSASNDSQTSGNVLIFFYYQNFNLSIFLESFFFDWTSSYKEQLANMLTEPTAQRSLSLKWQKSPSAKFISNFIPPKHQEVGNFLEIYLRARWKALRLKRRLNARLNQKKNHLRPNQIKIKCEKF